MPSEPERVFSGARKMLKNYPSSPNIESTQVTSVSEVLVSERSFQKSEIGIYSNIFNHVLNPCQNLNQPKKKIWLATNIIAIMPKIKLRS